MCHELIGVHEVDTMCDQVSLGFWGCFVLLTYILFIIIIIIIIVIIIGIITIFVFPVIIITFFFLFASLMAM